MSWGDKPELGALVAIPADCVNKSSGARQDGGEAWRRERKMRYGVGFAFFFFFLFFFPPFLHNFFINLNRTRAAEIVLFP